MRSSRNHRKALTAVALGFATAALFTTTASAQVRSEAVGATSSEVSYLSWGATADDLGPFAAAQAPSFSRITSPAELLRPGRARPVGDPYLSWGATADDLGPFQQTVVDRTKLPDGGNYDYSLDNSVAAACGTPESASRTSASRGPTATSRSCRATSRSSSATSPTASSRRPRSSRAQPSRRARRPRPR